MKKFKSLITILLMILCLSSCTSYHRVEPMDIILGTIKVILLPGPGHGPHPW
jgi:PBP1b-binding outer membrane lipoprotein LpoB